MSQYNTLFYENLPIDPSPLVGLIDQRYLQETIQAALALNIFSQLQTAATAACLAARNNWHEETLSRLLKVLKHQGCLESTPAGYRCTPLAAAYLVPDSFFFYGDKFGDPPESGSFAAALIACLRHEPATRTSPEPAWTPDRLRQMGVYALSGYVQNTVRRIDLSTAASLLDLGGGHGFYSIAFAQKHPNLQVTLFDLPVITESAHQLIIDAGLGQRISTLSGNFLHDPIGSNYDAVLCSNILHKDKRDIVLPKVYSALKPGGTLILRCRIADCPDTLSNALSKLYWQVYGGKDIYTADQWQSFVIPYGFTDFTLQGVDDIFGTFIARRA